MTDLVTNEGLNFIANRMLGVSENAFDTTNGEFTVSNGVTALDPTDTIAILKADGDYYQKVIISASYNTTTKQITTSAYLSSIEGNLLGSITKLGIDNNNGTGKLIQEHLFSPITKNDSKELYITIKTTLADNS